MRGKGITYDTGFLNAGVSTQTVLRPRPRRSGSCGSSTTTCTARPYASPAAIRTDWSSPPSHAAEAGLEVWLSPFTCDLTRSELLDLLSDCAERAERLRRGAPSSSCVPAPS